MTNATVSNAVKAVNGHTITLTYQGKEKTVSIADGTPIVTFAPATKADLKPGAGVIVMAEKAADGAISASQVTVGVNGVTPPM
jgi:TRAP-type mannitol/chloroaromatic compound transport system substrate-binding protein